jgi:superfamily II DNA/RNA helicase
MKYLDEGVDILITNLNKANRLIENRKIVLTNTNFFVIDESDVFVENSKRDFEIFIKLTQQKYQDKVQGQLFSIGCSCLPLLLRHYEGS